MKSIHLFHIKNKSYAFTLDFALLSVIFSNKMLDI